MDATNTPSSMVVASVKLSKLIVIEDFIVGNAARYPQAIMGPVRKAAGRFGRIAGSRPRLDDEG